MRRVGACSSTPRVTLLTSPALALGTAGPESEDPDPRLDDAALMDPPREPPEEASAELEDAMDVAADGGSPRGGDPPAPLPPALRVPAAPATPPPPARPAGAGQ